mgnify:CR=1 FL=1
MTNNNTRLWIIIFVAGWIFASAMEFFNRGSSPTPTAESPAPTNNFEYRYAKERFKQEGLSNSDADTAARAVILFNDAQKARAR